MPLSLRTLTLKDSFTLYHLLLKNKEHLAPWFEWAHDIGSILDCTEFIQQSQNRDFGIWNDGTMIGVVGHHAINWRHKHAEIGYWIAQDWQGKGLVQQAASSLIAYLLHQYQLNRIEILCTVHNQRSRKLAEKLGFTYEGIQREGYLFRDRYWDVACYSLLAREFRARVPNELIHLPSIHPQTPLVRAMELGP
ncbi:MAG: GNAT family N-acetyltransferase [Myxococcaceae bacterium]|nr:GNAT family N-acetyltransferase [Myxococcaceae bacterium]MBH2005731.1 GNAT family N-acetyltransferase [Myxococcaceae bacterium]